MDILSTQPTIGNTLFEFVFLVLVQRLLNFGLSLSGKNQFNDM